MVKRVVGGVPTLRGVLDLAEEDTVRWARVREMRRATGGYIDDEGLTFPMATHSVTALR